MSREETANFKYYISKAGITINELADRLGLQRASLSSRINGKIDFSRQEMNRISEIIGQPPEIIFFVVK